MSSSCKYLIDNGISCQNPRPSVIQKTTGQVQSGQSRVMENKNNFDLWDKDGLILSVPLQEVENEAIYNSSSQWPPPVISKQV